MTKMKQVAELMGKLVVVDAVLYPTYAKTAVDDAQMKARHIARRRLDEPRVGWVVGMRWLQEGFLNEGSYDEEGDYTRPWLGVSSTVPCLLVTFWPTKAPVSVPLDGYRIATTERPSYLHGKRDDGYRKLMSDIMKEEVVKLRRDEKGRFLPITNAPVAEPPTDLPAGSMIIASDAEYHHWRSVLDELIDEKPNDREAIMRVESALDEWEDKLNEGAR